MRVVWKFDLAIGQTVELTMPAGAEIVGYGFQLAGEYPLPRIWALCDPHAPLETRWFTTVATGALFEPGSAKELRSLGVAHAELAGGAFVLHGFELIS